MQQRKSRSRTRLALTLVAATALGSSLVIHAGPDKGGRGGMFGEQMIQRLDLDAEQQAMLDNIRSDMKKGFQQGRSQRQELKALVTAPSYDEAAVARVAKQMGDSMEQRIVANAKQFNQLYNSLSDEQRAELKAMREERKGRAKRTQQ